MSLSCFVLVVYREQKSVPAICTPVPMPVKVLYIRETFIQVLSKCSHDDLLNGPIGVKVTKKYDVPYN